jgi:hypothetical protein
MIGGNNMTDCKNPHCEERNRCEELEFCRYKNDFACGKITEPCASCRKAGWVKFFDIWYWGCDMSNCIHDDDFLPFQ